MQNVRSLEMLHQYGSTSRVLNLLRVNELNNAQKEYSRAPMFLNPKLNKTLIVKHRLRTDEEYLMPRRQKVVTKIIFPLVGNSLNFGGQSLFIGQNNYKNILSSATGSVGDELAHDMRILQLIHKLPSFDPFLLREHLRRNNHNPADCYFAIAPHETEQMQNFTANEIARLITIAFTGEGDDKSNDMVHKLVALILSNEADEKLEPFRIALGLEGESFREGIFAWRGFIYFKWQMAKLFLSIPEILNNLDKVRIFNAVNMETTNNIKSLKEQLKIYLRKLSLECKTIVSQYDSAFDGLVELAQANSFREFLLAGPKLFMDLGNKMGVISHIVSFWDYRFPKGGELDIDSRDFESILRDFNSSIENEKKNLNFAA